ncbi:MAG: hypothetical protein GC179_30390 [Anaerolineaceae bacterium]|nr:hypothetical protein [Anaerolineaceae bacterium]
MLQGVICEYLSQLCSFSKQITVNINSAQSLMTLSNNVVLWMIISGLVISLLAGLAFSSIVKSDMMSSYGGLVIILSAVGLLVLQANDLAYLVIVKFISISLMSVFGEQELDQLAKMGILAAAGFLLLILHTRYSNQAFPAVVTDVSVATGGLVVMRTVKYLPVLLPFIAVAVIVIVLHNHGMGADILTEFSENLIHGAIH